MNTPLPAECDCTCDGVIGVVVCPPPTIPQPDIPTRQRHRRNIPPGQSHRGNTPLREGRGGTREPDQPDPLPPRTGVGPYKEPTQPHWVFDEGPDGPDIGNPPTVPTPTAGPVPEHRQNQPGIITNTVTIRRAYRGGGIVSTPLPTPPGGPRVGPPKNPEDRKFPIDPNNPPVTPTPDPGGVFNTFS